MKAKPFIVGIAGGTGAGKTILAHGIADRINSKNVVIIQYDSYYKDRSHLPASEREKLNYDHPDVLETDLLIQHLKTLNYGQKIVVPVYDLETHCRSQGGVLVDSPQMVIVEGILVLAIESLRSMLDFKIFIDVEPDLRFIRRLRRDQRERGRDIDSIINQYLQTTRPMHHEFVEPSKQHADLLLNDVQCATTISNTVSVLTKQLQKRLNEENL